MKKVNKDVASLKEADDVVILTPAKLAVLEAFLFGGTVEASLKEVIWLLAGLGLKIQLKKAI